MAYAVLLKLHVTTVGISLCLFLLRNFWRLTYSTMNDKTWVKVVPHANDSLLLIAAIGMLFTGGLNPLVHGWLQAKIAGLLLYIVLGTIALKRGKTEAQRNLAFAAAIAVFAYIGSVAVSKQTIPGQGDSDCRNCSTAVSAFSNKSPARQSSSTTSMPLSQVS